jgi:glycosyltransferase involved in cell wall biosynthesis
VPLRIIGDGPERQALDAQAARSGADVRLFGSLPDRDVRDAYRRAAAVLLPGEEDFGIAPVEAQACGRPVIALARGGALETVVDGVTGILVDAPAADALAEGIRRARRTRFEPSAIRQHAVKFDSAVFERSMQSTIESLGHA